MIGDLQRTKIILNQSSDNSLIPGSIPTSSRPRPSSRPRTGDPSPPSLFACLFGIILWQSRKHLCAPFSVLTFLQILAPRASRTWPSCTPRGRPSPPSRRATRVQVEFCTGDGRGGGEAGHLELASAASQRERED